MDRDGERISFPDSNLKRVAARILTDKNKAWRYRPFSFPSLPTVVVSRPSTSTSTSMTPRTA
ncbi:hypothetical protein ACFSC4_07595 [Deinococcus malanensis]|uniref:hypothetical protein n=1 Tax=Deinococcus malanensis TaxID=1706855 RepID=UPI00363BC2CB